MKDLEKIRSSSDDINKSWVYLITEKQNEIDRLKERIIEQQIIIESFQHTYGCMDKLDTQVGKIQGLIDKLSNSYPSRNSLSPQFENTFDSVIQEELPISYPNSPT